MNIRDYFIVIAILVAAGLIAGCMQAPQSVPATPSQTVSTVMPSPTLPAARGLQVVSGNITTTKDLITFVRRQRHYARENGREKAIATFNDPNGPFVNRQPLYLCREL